MTEKQLTSRFYAKYPVEQLMTMTEEEIMQKIDLYLDQYIKSFEQRNPGRDLPSLSIPLKKARDKRTNAPKLGIRRNKK